MTLGMNAEIVYIGYQVVVSLSNTVNDKSHAREKLCRFRGFSMNRESFGYKCCEQWQDFQYR